MNVSDVPVLKTPVRLTGETVPLFARVTDAYQERDLVIDLSGTVVITSAGLGHLVSLGRVLSEHGAFLALAGGSRAIRRLFDTIGLSALMPHFRTVGEAVAWIRERDRSEEGRMEPS